MCLIVLVRVFQRGRFVGNVRHDHFGEQAWRYGWKPCRRPSGRCRRLRRRRWAGRAHGVAVTAVHANGPGLMATEFTFLPPSCSLFDRAHGGGGQAATASGISQSWSTHWSSIIGGLRWIPTIPMSEQCTAPHMLMQQASEMRTGAGRRMFLNSSNMVSITALTGPEASVAGGCGSAPSPWGARCWKRRRRCRRWGTCRSRRRTSWPARSSFRPQVASPVTMNSMLLRVVQRTCPSQYLSAISQISRMLVTDIVRRHVHLIAGSATHEHAGFQDFVVQPFAEVLLDDFRKNESYLRGPISRYGLPSAFSGL